MFFHFAAPFTEELLNFMYRKAHSVSIPSNCML